MAKGDRNGMRGVAARITNEFEVSRKTYNQRRIQETISEWRKNGDIRVENGRVVESERAQREMVQLAEDLANDVRIKDPVVVDDYRELRNELKGPLYLSREDRANITDWSSYARSSENQLNFTLNRDNISVDSKYHDLLNGKFGYWFRDNEATNPVDQVRQMNDVLYELRQRAQGERFEDVYGRQADREMRDALTASVDWYVQEELLRQASRRRR